MGFFKKEHKKMAETHTYGELKSGYEITERRLLNISRKPSKNAEKDLKEAMKEHALYEYALLYRNSPKFRNR